MATRTKKRIVRKENTERNVNDRGHIIEEEEEITSNTKFDINKYENYTIVK